MGATLEECLKNIPLHVRELVLHAISHGATFALAGAELSGANVGDQVTPTFVGARTREDFRELVEEFQPLGTAMAEVSHLENLLNKPFLD